MKKLIIVLIFLTLIMPIFAQDEEKTDRNRADPFYAINNSSNRSENFYYVMCQLKEYSRQRKVI